MTDRQERFIAEYLACLNAAEAARRAGYSAKVADREGHRLLRNAEIASAIAQGKARQLETAELSAARVLEELRRLAFSDVSNLFDQSGNLRPLKDLTPEQSACIGSLEVVKRNLTSGDGEMDTVYKLKVWDKPRSLEMLAKHFELLTEKVKVEGEGDMVARLAGARKRTA